MNILIGGKLGDFIHCMYVPFYLYKTTGIASHIYMCDSGNSYFNNANFEFGLENTYKELYPIVMQQEYVKSFSLWNNQKIDINTIKFRDSEFLYKTCWTEILTNTFFGVNQKPLHGAWMRYDKSIPKDDDTLLISRKLKNSMPQIVLDEYKRQIAKYKKVIYLGSPQNYQEFAFKDLCANEFPQTLSDWFVQINSAKAFLANQSGPAAIACALNAPRVIELLPKSTHLDDIHYIGEAQYSDKISFIYPQ
jgi:hypothetical protein